MMPRTLVLVRHGESVGNVASRAAHEGDESLYTDEFRNAHGRQWDITSQGRDEAAAIGSWIHQNFGAFDRYYVSPYRRTTQTAAAMRLPDARWLLNRSLREREYGDWASLPPSDRHTDIEARGGTVDGLYWAPPQGESLADVAENRVRNFLDTLHRECSGQQIIAVSHGQTMLAFKAVLERLTDEEIVALANDRKYPKNGEAWVYRIGGEASHLNQFQTAKPTHADGRWSVTESEPTTFGMRSYSNGDLELI